MTTDATTSAKSPRGLRIFWAGLGLLVLFLIFRAKANAVLVFLGWSLVAGPVVFFSKYRPLPKRKALAVTTVVVWLGLIVASVALIFVTTAAKQSQTWEEVKLPPLIGIPLVLSWFVFPLIIAILAQMATARRRHGDKQPAPAPQVT